MPFSLGFRALPAATALAALLPAACAAPPPTTPGAALDSGPTTCPESRPQVCTMIYAPVCADHLDGRRETHASACNACADDTALAYVEGPCEEESTP